MLIAQATEIDDATAAILAEMTDLDSLALNNNPITDKGIEKFKNLKNATRIALTGTKVTAAGVADLQKALPKCKIEWDAPKE